MNYKRTLCYLAISALATSLHADTANEQELHGQLAVKQQELHELGQKIIKQQSLIRETKEKMEQCIIEYADMQTKECDKSDFTKSDDLKNELNSFVYSFFKEGKKELLVSAFKKNSDFLSEYAFLKFYLLNMAYEHIILVDLVSRWEETAQEINALFAQVDHWAIK